MESHRKNYFTWKNRHYTYHKLHGYSAKARYTNGKNNTYLCDTDKRFCKELQQKTKEAPDNGPKGLKHAGHRIMATANIAYAPAGEWAYLFNNTRLCQ